MADLHIATGLHAASIYPIGSTPHLFYEVVPPAIIAKCVGALQRE